MLSVVCFDSMRIFADIRMYHVIYVMLINAVLKLKKKEKMYRSLLTQPFLQTLYVTFLQKREDKIESSRAFRMPTFEISR